MPEPVELVIGIDIGLTSIKVAAFSPSGQTVAARRPTPARSAPGGVHEIDMRELWTQVSAALREVVELQPAPWRVTSIGVTGHGNGLYPIDSSGAPAGPAITSSDTRAAALVRALPATTHEALRDLTGCFPWPGQPLVLLSWLRPNKPEVYDTTAAILGCKDWVRYCLTGVAGTDRTDASASGLLGGDYRNYAVQVFDLLGLPDSAFATLPPLLESDGLAGTVTEQAAAETLIPVGTPVATGCLDCVAGVIAADATHLGDTTLILGTWAVTAVVSKPLPSLAEILMAVPLPGDSAYVLCLNSAPASGGALDWVLDTLGLQKESAFSAAERIDAGSDGLIFLPFVHGLPELPGARGAFIGMHASHTSGHIVRATLEGIAHYYRRQLLRHVRSGVTPSGTFRLIGGGARSDLWAQILADTLQHTVERVDSDELGALGAALLAASAVGDKTASAGLRGKARPAPFRVRPLAGESAAAEHMANFDRWYSAAEAVWNASKETK